MARWKPRRTDKVARKCAVPRQVRGNPGVKRCNFGRKYRFENASRDTPFFRFSGHRLELRKRRDGSVDIASDVTVEVDTDPAAPKFKSSGPINIIYTIRYKEGGGSRPPTVIPNLVRFEFSPRKHGRIQAPWQTRNDIHFDDIRSVCWAISPYTVRRA